jgi:hypothetical protein
MGVDEQSDVEEGEREEKKRCEHDGKQLRRNLLKRWQEWEILK